MRVTLLVTQFPSKIQDLTDFTKYGTKKKKINKTSLDILMNFESSSTRSFSQQKCPRNLQEGLGEKKSM